MSAPTRSHPPHAALSPRAARVFYAVADAWFPPGPGGEPGAGDLDVVAFLGPHLDPAERRRLEWTLACLEVSPRLLRHPRRGFCWLSRDERRAWLARAERCGWSRVPQALGRVRARAESAYREALGEASAERAPGPDHSASRP